MDVDDDAPAPKVIPKDAATMSALLDSVKTNVLFQHLEDHELNAVLDAMFKVEPKAGTVIIQQGDEGDNFYVIHSGTTEVLIGDEAGGEPNKVSEITDGGSFGELALIYGTPRAATIKAVTDCVLWAIDRDTYRRILMGATIKRRKKYEAFLEKVTLLSSLDKWERLSVADALEPASFSATEVIMKQGDLGDAFYIIEEGECSVTRTNEQGQTGKVNDLKVADYFGEIALLEPDGKRMASVTAITDVKCAKLDRERFERVLGPCSDILKRNMDNYKNFVSE
jgi:cAMP-dependent protein kinase regulator